MCSRSVDDVRSWLLRNGFDDVVEDFRENGVDGEIVLAMVRHYSVSDLQFVVPSAKKERIVVLLERLSNDLSYFYGEAGGNEDSAEGDELSDMQHPFKFKLWKALSENIPSTQFSVGGEAFELPAIPGLVIKGIGDIPLPLLENSEVTKGVISICRQAPFGKGLETVLDTSVRRTWELEPSLFSFTNPNWNNGLQRLLLRVCNLMGCADDKEVESGSINPNIKCHLYKLLVYEVGGHFLYHRDTEKEPGMFATLVVQLPSKYKGGNLIIKHRESTHVHDFGSSSGSAPYVVHFAAHFADLQHKVEEVTSGVRVAVVYSVCWVGLGPIPSVSEPDTQAPLVASILEQWDTTACEKLAYCLGHQYTELSIRSGAAVLKGTDRKQLNLLLNANSILSPDKKLNVYLALARRNAAFSSHDDYSPEDDCDWELGYETINITTWVDVNGFDFKGGKHIHVDFETEVLNDAWSDATIINTDFEGFTGNEGATKETLYHCAIVVFWPALQEMDLIRRHGGVSSHVYFLECIANKYSNPEQNEEMEKLRANYIRELLTVLRAKDTDHTLFSSVISAEPSAYQSMPSIESVLLSDIELARQFLSECTIISSGSICRAIVSIGNIFGWPNIIDLVLPILSTVTINHIQFGVSLFVAVAESYSLKLNLSEGIKCHFIHLLSLAVSSSNVNELQKLAEVCLTLSDLSFARQFIVHLSKCGVLSLEIAKIIVRIIHQFGCASVFDLIPGVFSVLCSAEEGACGLLSTLLIEYREEYESVLVPIIREMMEYLVQCCAIELASDLIDVISNFKDSSFSRKVVLEVMLPIGLKPDNAIVADAIASIGRITGWSSLNDLIPMLFHQITSFCTESCSSLLASLLKENAELGRTCCAIVSAKALMVTSSCALPVKDLVSLIVDVFHPLEDVAALTQLVSNIIQHSDSDTIGHLVSCLHAKLGDTLLKEQPLASIVKKRIEKLVSTISTLPVQSWKFPSASTMPSHHTQVTAFLRGNADSVTLLGFSDIQGARNFVQQYQKSLPVSMEAGGSGRLACVKMTKTQQVKLDYQRTDRLSRLRTELKELCALVPGNESIANEGAAMAVTMPAQPAMLKTSPHLHPATSAKVNHGHSISCVASKPPAVKRVKTECIVID